VICEYAKDILGKKMQFSNNIDYNEIHFHTRDVVIDIKKNIDEGNILGHFKFKNIIDVNYEVELSLKNKPLRVLNPADFDH
jgi:hypothetical protein